MQHWLEGYFNSSASQLTSTRLQAAREQHTALRSAAAAAAAAAAPQAEQAAGGAIDVPSPVPRCDAACSRVAAIEVLAARERHGKPLPLRWQPSADDPQRWVASASGESSGGAACRLRQPREKVQRDYLVIAPVGNDLTVINRCVGPLVGRQEQWVALRVDGSQLAVVPLNADSKQNVSTCAAPLPLLLPRAGGWTTLTLQPLIWCCCITAMPASCAARTALR
jgi:hypothetical protein